jgi:hypothetical protein
VYALGHRVARIDSQVEQRILEPGGVDPGWRNVDRELRSELDLRSQCARQQH